MKDALIPVATRHDAPSAIADELGTETACHDPRHQHASDNAATATP